MKRVRMLEDREGARKGDVLGFERDDEADALVAQGKAVDVKLNQATGKYDDVAKQGG